MLTMPVRTGRLVVRMLYWLTVALAGSACTPALDWREVRPEGSGALASFPCKPSSHSRTVTLAGAAMQLSLYACSAADVTYAVAVADVQDPARVRPVLEELGRAARTNIQSADSSASAPLHVQGMTPNPLAMLWRLDGRRQDGRAVQEQMALFVHGTRVFQATAIGVRLDVQALETFFGALHFPS